jgi:acetolactate synthase-1/2/3 large subunit
VIIAGHGVRLSGAQEQLKKLVEIFNIPLLTSINGMDLIEDNHKLFFGRPNYWGQREANFIVQNADLVISIGAGLHLETTGFDPHKFAREAKIVVVDIDPAETIKSYLNINLSIVADASSFISSLLKHRIKIEIGAWLEYCENVRTEFKFNQFPTSENMRGLSIYDVVQAISDASPENCTIIHGNAGGHFTTPVQCFRVKKNQRLMSSIGIGAMGASLPMGIGASFAAPNKTLIVFTGDGGFQFNMQELATMLGNKLPIHIFVFENQGYASLRSTQRRYFDGRLIASSPESNLFLPEIDKIIKAYGIPIEEVFEMSTVSSAIQRNLSLHCAVTIFHIDPENPIQPRLGSTMKSNGQMESDPLEDLSPHLTDAQFEKWMIIPSLRE